MKATTVKKVISFLLLLIGGLLIGIVTVLLPKINLFIIGNYNNHIHLNDDSKPSGNNTKDSEPNQIMTESRDG